MQTHPAVRVGLELATDGIQFYVLNNWWTLLFGGGSNNFEVF